MARRATNIQVSTNQAETERDYADVVLLEERLRVVVAVNIDLRERVEDGSVLASGLHTSLEPREDELETVTSLDLVDELVDDAEATRYAKRKFGDLQGKRGAAGRNTRFGKQRRTKW